MSSSDHRVPDVGRKFWISFLMGSILIAAATGIGIFSFYKKTIDLELTLLEKTYKPGEQIRLSAVVMTRSFKSLQTLINARIVSADTNQLLQTYFPILERKKEYKFDFDYTIPAHMSSGQYRLVVKIMSYSRTDSIDDLASIERSFTVKPPRKLTAKEIATKKAVNSGKGIPIDADLILYPIEEEYVKYGKTIPLIGMFKNITYWDGDYKLSVTVIDPKEEKKEFTRDYRLSSNKQQEFTFEYEISNEKPEGRYAVMVRLLNNREGKKGFGNLISEIVSSFSLIDEKPAVNLDNIELSIPGRSEYEFKVGADDDRGIVEVLFSYETQTEGMVKNVARLVTLKKKKQTHTAAMQLASGNEREGVWTCKIMMPSEGGKFLFSVQVKDTKEQVVTTEQYPISIIKPIKIKKTESFDDLKPLPGFEGYGDWQ
ncbi:MAG: hypothetical protein ABII23_00750, partial [bacterium]